MKPIPKAKSDELLEQAKRLFDSDNAPDALTRVRIVKQIKVQIARVPGDANAHGALLIMNVLDRDVAAAKATYQRALALAGSGTELLQNATSAYLHLGDPDASLQVAREAVRRFPGEGDALRGLARIGYLTGRARVAKEALGGLEKTNLPSVSFDDDIARLADFLDRHGISDEESASVVSPMIKALAKVTHRPGDGAALLVVYPAETHGYERAVLRFQSFAPEDRISDVLEDYGDQVMAVPFRLLRAIGADVEPSRPKSELRAA